MMPRSRPISDLPYPFSPTQQWGEPQGGGLPAAAQYGCSQVRKVSSLLLLCSFVTIFCSRPGLTLLFQLPLANAAVAGAAGRWLADHGITEARPLLLAVQLPRPGVEGKIFLFSCSFVMMMMPHSRPSRALPFTLLLLRLWPWF